MIVDVEGFEGPLDVLLELARRQKVDLRHISILALAEQYLGFIEEARRVRLELAADYLVMAAWLAYLKSRLLLPEPPVDDEEPLADELAAALASRLQKLEAIRKAAGRLDALPQLGREMFLRGNPEPLNVINRPQWQANIYDLLDVYGQQCQRRMNQNVILKRREVLSLTEAREMLAQWLPKGKHDWLTLDEILRDYFKQTPLIHDAKASSFSAALEMVKEGRLELRQDAPFAPLWMKHKSTLMGEGETAS
jgi:segregation and condensation protein A